MGEGQSRRASRLLFPVCVSLLTFSNSLDGAFVIDDGSAVRTNQDLRSETPLSQLLVRDFWGRPIDAPTSVKSYRPLTVLTFRWNFSAHGLDVWGYHAVNVLLHALCTALVHLLARAVAQLRPAHAHVDRDLGRRGGRGRRRRDRLQAAGDVARDVA